MTAEAIIEELKTLGPTDRSKVCAFLVESDDSWVPESFKIGMEEALSGKLVDMEKVMNGDAPPSA